MTIKHISHITTYFAVLLFLLVTQGCKKDLPAETETLLTELDKTVREYSGILARDEYEIDSIRATISKTDSDKKLQVYAEMFERYKFIDNDSAMEYAFRMIDEAKDTVDLSRGRYNLAKAYICRGHETDAYQCLVETFPDTANAKVKPYYYDLMIFRKEFLGENPVRWYERFLNIYPSGSFQRTYAEAFLAAEKGNPEKGIYILHRNKKLFEGDRQNMSDYHALEAKLHLLAGDTLSAITGYANSALIDMSLPRHYYRSLSALAGLLEKTNQTARAYCYIRTANERINASGIAGEISMVNGTMEDVFRTYEMKLRQQKERRNYLIVIMGILGVMLTVTLAITRKAHRRTRQAIAAREESVKKLKEANSKLNNAVHMLQESDKVKTAYLLQYINQCSSNIDNLEKLKRSVELELNARGTDGVRKVILRTDFSNELKKFYADFDTTFLSLFPDFVKELNLLLKPECAVSLNKDGTMSNELRTLALIRLGITDSAKIATFLRRSVTTVYNYRVKMRNQSLADRDDFEESVARIME